MQHTQNARCIITLRRSIFGELHKFERHKLVIRVPLPAMRVQFFLICMLLILSGASQAQLASPLALWVQLGDLTEARALVNGTVCPLLMRDGAPLPMSVRAAATPDFPLLCGAPIPAGTKAVTFNGTALPLPVSNPQRILVLGDTGCRIKDPELQACNDPKAWVFPKLAAAAAKLKPDLIIDLGDYVSREGQCPARFSGCMDSPFGDNWLAWRTDFFSPAAPLLATAPIILTRGNHEDCTREGAGWLRLMSPMAFNPQAACAPHVAPFFVSFTRLTLAVLDTSGALEADLVPDLASSYADDLAGLARISTPLFMVQHRPIWGAISGPLDIPIGGNATLSAGVNKSGIPANVDLMLSGHIHGFEAMNYYDGFPPQIIGGNGGDLLHDIPRLLKGAVFQGTLAAGVKDGVSASGFGFLVLRPAGSDWFVDTYDQDGTLKFQCRLKNRRIDCAK